MKIGLKKHDNAILKSQNCNKIIRKFSMHLTLNIPFDVILFFKKPLTLLWHTF